MMVEYNCKKLYISVMEKANYDNVKMYLYNKYRKREISFTIRDIESKYESPTSFIEAMRREGLLSMPTNFTYQDIDTFFTFSPEGFNKINNEIISNKIQEDRHWQFFLLAVIAILISIILYLLQG
jgi:hypothetical protein